MCCCNENDASPEGIKQKQWATADRQGTPPSVVCRFRRWVHFCFSFLVSSTNYSVVENSRTHYENFASVSCRDLTTFAPATLCRPCPQHATETPGAGPRQDKKSTLDGDGAHLGRAMSFAEGPRWQHRTGVGLI